MSQVKKKNAKAAAFITSVFILFAFLVFFKGMIPRANAHPHPVKIDGVVLAQPLAITNFKLTDIRGKAFDKHNLKGRWTMMFFGFTNCGAVCPTTLAELNKMYKSLQAELPDDKLPQVVMISVDPERDTLARLSDYVAAFNPHFTGARGEETDLIALEKQLHIVSAKMQADGQGKDHYTINHSAEIILFNPNADVQAFLSYPHEAGQMVKDYKAILAVESKS